MSFLCNITHMYCRLKSRNKQCGCKEYTCDDVATTNKKRILVVDDNEFNRHFVFRLLKKLGLDCVCVNSGNEAIDTLTDNPNGYSLMLLDLHMPGIDGWECAERIRSMVNSGSIDNIVIIMNTTAQDAPIDARSIR